MIISQVILYDKEGTALKVFVGSEAIDELETLGYTEIEGKMYYVTKQLAISINNIDKEIVLNIQARIPAIYKEFKISSMKSKSKSEFFDLFEKSGKETEFKNEMLNMKLRDLISEDQIEFNLI